jgi:chaperonin GroES
MHLRPLHDRLIVQRVDEDSTQRLGTIVIPDSAKEKPQRGTVPAAGLGKSNEEGTRLPMDVKAGDIDYLIMKEDDVLAVQERAL